MIGSLASCLDFSSPAGCCASRAREGSPSEIDPARAEVKKSRRETVIVPPVHESNPCFVAGRFRYMRLRRNAARLQFRKKSYITCGKINDAHRTRSIRGLID